MWHIGPEAGNKLLQFHTFTDQQCILFLKLCLTEKNTTHETESESDVYFKLKCTLAKLEH